MYYVQIVCQKGIPNLSFKICVLGAIGMDCTNLGISSSHKSTSTAPASEDSKSQGEAGNLDLHINYLLAFLFLRFFFLCQDKLKEINMGMSWLNNWLFDFLVLSINRTVSFFLFFLGAWQTLQLLWIPLLSWLLE